MRYKIILNTLHVLQILYAPKLCSKIHTLIIHVPHGLMAHTTFYKRTKIRGETVCKG